MGLRKLSIWFIAAALSAACIQVSAADTTDLKAAATLAKTAYDSGDLKVAADKTLQVIKLIEAHEDYKSTYHLIFIEQYLDIAGGSPEESRTAALEMQPHYDALVDRVGLGDSRVQELGFTIAKMLSGRSDMRNIKKANEWLKAIYLRESDDPWFALIFDVRQAHDLRKYRNVNKTKTAFKKLLGRAQALDPSHSVTREVELSIAKFYLEIRSETKARRLLRELADRWSAQEDPPSMDIILALGLLAGHHAEKNRFASMEEIYAEMLDHKPPRQCEPIPIFLRTPQVQCYGCNKDGSLLIEYDINDKGLVENVQVLDKQVPKAAVKSMTKTMSEWRYYPAVADGTPTRTDGVKVQFNVIGQ